MSEKRKTVLFLTPGASSVGGNIFLLNFLRWFKTHSSVPFVTVYGHGGDLEDEFRKLSPAFNFDHEWKGSGLLSKAAFKVAQRRRVHERSLVRQLDQHNVGLIYSNAVINHKVLRELHHWNVPLITHCHELESLIYKHGTENFNYVKGRTDRFVAVAEAVRQNLINNHGVDSEKIDVVHEFIPLTDLSPIDIASKRKQVLAEHGLPDNAFIVGASGTMYWRKAPDLFIQIAAKVRRLRPDAPIYFLWIGGSRAGDFARFEAAYDVNKLGLNGRVHFLEHSLDPTPYFAALDVFAMVSREDPFPLVCLETAALSKPLICFDEAGGMPELVREECGFIVPYLDLDSFAANIVSLYDDRPLSRQLGENAALRVRSHHDIEHSAPRVAHLIDRYLSGNST